MTNISIRAYLLLVLLFILPWLSSCKKDEEAKPVVTTPDKTTPAGICQILKYTVTIPSTNSSGSSTITRTYEYDLSSQGYVIKISQAANDYSTLEYNISNQLVKSIRYRQTDKTTSRYEYDEQGRWIKTFIEYSPLSGGVTSTTNGTVTYDASGNRVQVDMVSSTGYNTKRVYTYPAPNIVEEVLSFTDINGPSGKTTILREFYTDKEDKTYSDEVRLAPFFGQNHAYKYLIKKLVIDNGKETREYSYEVNEQGYPTKATAVSTFPDKPNFNGSATYEYKCN